MSDAILSRQSLKDQIKNILIDRIVSGALGPGERIKELQIAREFGTSQAPVREAIRCLETLGYIEHIPHVGAMVRTFNPEEIEEAYQVREALESYAVSLMTPEMSELIPELEGCLEEMEAAVEQGNIRRFTTADNRFHRAIIRSSGNETMMSFWESLKMQIQVVAILVDTSMALKRIYQLHQPIVAALKELRNEDASVHLSTHYAVIKDHWKKQEKREAA